MTIKAKIGGTKYDLLSLNYSFGRNKSGLGAPSGNIIYGEVKFSFNASADEMLKDASFHDFLSKEKNRKDITIDFLNSEQISARNISIKGAAIVDLSESFDNTKTVITVTVCSPDITIGGKPIVKGDWK